MSKKLTENCLISETNHIFSQYRLFFLKLLLHAKAWNCLFFYFRLFLVIV